MERQNRPKTARNSTPAAELINLNRKKLPGRARKINRKYNNASFKAYVCL